MQQATDILQHRQAALSAVLQQIGCIGISSMSNPVKELRALVQSSAAEVKMFLIALGLEYLACSDWRLVSCGMILTLMRSNSTLTCGCQETRDAAA